MPSFHWLYTLLPPNENKQSYYLCNVFKIFEIKNLLVNENIII